MSSKEIVADKINPPFMVNNKAFSVEIVSR